MAKGYMGKLLFVDLSTGEIKTETPEDSLYRDFIGGYGLGARILYSPQKDGPLAGVSADIEAQINENLDALDWDRVTTRPSKKKLLELGLDDVAQELWP